MVSLLANLDRPPYRLLLSVACLRVLTWNVSGEQDGLTTVLRSMNHDTCRILTWFILPVVVPFTVRLFVSFSPSFFSCRLQGSQYVSGSRAQHVDRSFMIISIPFIFPTRSSSCSHGLYGVSVQLPIATLSFVGVYALRRLYFPSSVSASLCSRRRE
jgi:hypothetical protein